VVPVVLTVWFLLWFGTTLEKILHQLVVVLLPERFYFPGLGIGLSIAFIYAVGILLQIFFVERLWQLLENWLKRMPIIRTIYVAINDFMGFFSSSVAERSSKVVRVELGPDIRLIGFITDQSLAAIPASGADEIAVYLPLSYQIGGYTVMVPRDKVEVLQMSVEAAMRFTLTAGMNKQPSAKIAP